MCKLGTCAVDSLRSLASQFVFLQVRRVSASTSAMVLGPFGCSPNRERVLMVCSQKPLGSGVSQRKSQLPAIAGRIKEKAWSRGPTSYIFETTFRYEREIRCCVKYVGVTSCAGKGLQTQ